MQSAVVCGVLLSLFKPSLSSLCGAIGCLMLNSWFPRQPTNQDSANPRCSVCANFWISCYFPWTHIWLICRTLPRSSSFGGLQRSVQARRSQTCSVHAVRHFWILEGAGGPSQTTAGDQICSSQGSRTYGNHEWALTAILIVFECICKCLAVLF